MDPITLFFLILACVLVGAGMASGEPAPSAIGTIICLVILVLNV